MRALFVFVLLACPLSLAAQWQIQTSPIPADLRAVHALSSNVAWASGSNGTVLRTADGGASWISCAVPTGAARADLIAVQAINDTTAIVMTSGKGKLSRLYRTTDSCQTWKLVFTNPDPDNLFVSLRRVTSTQLYLLATPVAGKFSMFLSQDSGATWFIADDPGLDATAGDTAIPVSNSSLIAVSAFLYFGTGGGTSAPHIYFTHPQCDNPATPDACSIVWGTTDIPAPAGSFVTSLASRSSASMSGKLSLTLLALLGMAKQPDSGVIATSTDGGHHWATVGKPIPGYGSAVVYDGAHAVWIAVGSAGTALSRDSGATWELVPSSAASSTPAWTALSLPFAVGPHGSIGKLQDVAVSK